MIVSELLKFPNPPNCNKSATG